MAPASTLVEVLAQLVYCHWQYGLSIEILSFFTLPFCPYKEKRNNNVCSNNVDINLQNENKSHLLGLGKKKNQKTPSKKTPNICNSAQGSTSPRCNLSMHLQPYTEHFF